MSVYSERKPECTQGITQEQPANFAQKGPSLLQCSSCATGDSADYCTTLLPESGSIGIIYLKKYMTIDGLEFERPFTSFMD